MMQRWMEVLSLGGWRCDPRLFCRYTDVRLVIVSCVYRRGTNGVNGEWAGPLSRYQGHNVLNPERFPASKDAFNDRKNQCHPPTCTVTMKFAPGGFPWVKRTAHEIPYTGAPYFEIRKIEYHDLATIQDLILIHFIIMWDNTPKRPVHR